MGHFFFRHGVSNLIWNFYILGLRLFGAFDLVQPFWRGCFGAETIRRRDVLALGRFGAETVRRRDDSVPSPFGAETIRRSRFVTGRSQMFLVQKHKA